MISPEWPELTYAEWENTCDTLHMWTQIVGKTRMALTPLENHWWNVTLRVTPRGLRTPPIPWRRETFEVEFDLLAHRLAIRTSEGRERGMPLYARSVADFFGEYKANLESLGIRVHIDPNPQEFDDPTPHDQDTHHASYDTKYIERFRRVLLHADRALKRFRARYVGKSSPVHFFWGSFDLAATRFCGRKAKVAADADHMTREAYSHECISCGFWPGDRRYPHAAFYAYAMPAPAGFAKAPVRPEAARWVDSMGEFFLKYEDARNADQPEEAILEFCQSTYEAAAGLAGWDRAALERQG